ncbi:hypothetical protein [Winogradskyella sp.]|uniref:hypothetical protein n=1 Tax=Winogradskyella sp. TaxID=1883156 RepID=UPI0026382805|nr:hypothetical protein [Winogradskyella sp.]
MNSLSKDQIHFIDNYLENSDVLYADIRMEMVDHVGSAIEKQMKLQKTEDFYSVFKDYMVASKANLLENNKKFLRDVDKGIFKRLFRLLSKPRAIIAFILLVFISYKVMTINGHNSIVDIFYWFPNASIVPFLILYFVMLKVFKLSRFSGVERLVFVYMVFFQLLNLLRILFRGYFNSETANYVIISVVVSTMILIPIVLLQLTYHIMNQYRLKYKSI